VNEVKNSIPFEGRKNVWWTPDHTGSGLFAGWETSSGAHGKHEEVLTMYLLEWHGELKSGPDAVVLVNKGIEKRKLCCGVEFRRNCVQLRLGRRGACKWSREIRLPQDGYELCHEEE